MHDRVEVWHACGPVQQRLGLGLLQLNATVIGLHAVKIYAVAFRSRRDSTRPKHADGRLHAVASTTVLELVVEVHHPVDGEKDTVADGFHA